MGRNWLVYPMDVLEYKAPKQNEWDNTFEDDIIGRIDMERWIDTLSDEQRTIVELLIDGMTYQEIGEIFNISKMAVWFKADIIRTSYKKYFK